MICLDAFDVLICKLPILARRVLKLENFYDIKQIHEGLIENKEIL